MADIAETAVKTGNRSADAEGPRVRTLRRYGYAMTAVALAFGARMALGPILYGEAPYLLFVPAVLVAAGVGGFGPGVLATALGLPLGSFFIEGFPVLTPAEIVSAALFALIGLAMAWGGAQLHQSHE